MYVNLIEFPLKKTKKWFTYEIRIRLLSINILLEDVLILQPI